MRRIAVKRDGHIRLSIEMLLPWSKQIAGCRSFDELFGMFFGNNSNHDLQSAVGENFADEYCIQYAPHVGFDDFRPATGKEDWEEGTDAVGFTHRFVEKGQPAAALRQDKTYNPFNPKLRLELKDLAGLLVPLAQGKVKGGNAMVFTTLPMHRISLGVRKAFSWIVARDHYESELNGNARFFADFAARIVAESKVLDGRRRENLAKGAHALMRHQRAALAHVSKRRRSFVCLPPGSGKTEIQARVAERWLKDHPVTVYVAPTLALLDQNFYKVARHCRKSYRRVVMACSAKDFSVYDAETGILKRSEIVFGSVSGDEVRQALAAPGRKLVGTTYKSYPRLVEFFKEHSMMFDRIADEALEVVPSRASGHAESAKDIREREDLWKAFADNSIVNRSACFDAFEKVRRGTDEVRGMEVGTNNADVFGERFRKSFDDMIGAGTIVPARIRAVIIDDLDLEKMDGYSQPGWTRDDKINFTALCYVVDHVIQDKGIHNKKIVAFMHRARVCPHFVAPLRRYLKGKVIEYADAIVADTDDRNRILNRYREAAHALIANFGILGRGLDDCTTNAVFVGRNMASVYGMHGIHRPCRSHPDEFAKPPAEHFRKPCGYVYVAVVEGDLATREQRSDLEAILKSLESWQDDFEVVKVVHSNEGDGVDIDRPMPVFETKPIQSIPGLYEKIKVFEAEFRVRRSKVEFDDMEAGMNGFDSEIDWDSMRGDEERDEKGMREYEKDRKKREGMRKGKDK